MELSDLGFDDWFRRQGEPYGSEYRMARVTAVDRDRYLVRNDRGEVPAEVAGRLRFSAESSVDLPCVGDWTAIQDHDAGTLAIIHHILPRKSVLRRKSAGRKSEYQLISANIDVAFIVQSCDRDFNLRRLERYLVMVNEGRIAPVVLLNKADLVCGHDLEQKIRETERAGIAGRVLGFSAKTGSGLDRVQQELERGKTYCLVGSSGVGKTTLLNRLLGREVFETHPVREQDGRGRHTTSRRQLIVLDGGAMLIDNPGMRELGVIGIGAGLDESFSDIHELSEGCRFRDCTHTQEAGCSVLAAVESGELSEERYRSYMKLMKESEHHERSYVERRRRDRAFGRFIKSAMRPKKRKNG